MQDANDKNALIRALAIRTMSYIAVPEVLLALVEPLRHCLKDRDPYVRKTAAICVAKLYVHDRRIVEKHDFLTLLRDLLGDTNPTVVANAVAALTEISERSDNIQLRLNGVVAGRLVSAMGECSECVPAPVCRRGLAADFLVLQVGANVHPRGAHVLRARGAGGRGASRRAHSDPAAALEQRRRPHDNQGHHVPHELHGQPGDRRVDVQAAQPTTGCVPSL